MSIVEIINHIQSRTYVAEMGMSKRRKAKMKMKGFVEKRD
jgi:hypothetical protein